MTKILNSTEVNAADLKKLDESFYGFLNNKKMTNQNVSIDQVENITLISEDLDMKPAAPVIRNTAINFTIDFIDDVR